MQRASLFAFFLTSVFCWCTFLYCRYPRLKALGVTWSFLVRMCFECDWCVCAFNVFWPKEDRAGHVCFCEWMGDIELAMCADACVVLMQRRRPTWILGSFMRCDPRSPSFLTHAQVSVCASCVLTMYCFVDFHTDNRASAVYRVSTLSSIMLLRICVFVVLTVFVCKPAVIQVSLRSLRWRPRWIFTQN